MRVMYSSLNFRDVMTATGKISESHTHGNRATNLCSLGFEYSGISDTGRRVMGMLEYGALATHINVDPTLMWDVPSYWSLQDAATIPVIYVTVYTCLFIKTKIEKGKKILIHAGTGGVGLAAIRVCLAYGVEVFTTVSTQEKRDYLLSLFPQLKPSHIGNSRDLSFFEMVMFETKGAGVDYVLNSLADDKLLTSIQCLGKKGQFLEIGKFDILNNSKIGMSDFIRELSFHAVLVDNLFYENFEEKEMIRELIFKDIRSGIIVPIKTTVFPAAEVEQAFRYLASGRHMGKVLLKIRENEGDEETLPIAAMPRTYFDKNLSYIMPGGLGGFGLELADWMVIRGCRKLVLSSSRGLTKPYQKYRIE